MHGPSEEACERSVDHHQPRVTSLKVLVCVEDAIRRRLRVLDPQASANARSRGFIMLLWVAMVAANHCRSFHRPRPSRYLSDLTLYVPPLLAALGKFAVKPLKALLLDVQPIREGVEAFERSALEPTLELAFPGFSSPPQRQGQGTMLLYGLSRTEELFGCHPQSSS